MTVSSPAPTQLLQDFVGDFYSRRLLLHNPLYQTPTAASSPVAANSHKSAENYGGSDNSFDANVVMVLSVLLCALICSLGLNSIIRCALRCSSLVASESSGSISARTANTGVKRKALKTFPTVSYSAELNQPGLDTECAICLSDFTPGERVRLLPKCNHGFHVRCIDKWLSSHSSCPKCRHCLMETCQKIVGSCSQASPSEPPPTVQEIIVSIAPLEREGLVHNYRGLIS
ncbi:RING-H2 finger protein ATL78 [Morella rubra]|uniref:RING-type E3 ubiquitin transferase n=1 Tax=Morella rubra TaxID=262757 RepID=A0A6A1V731_9ROSI|nr:RING-H2 finger protein ATL78 [Morella rubra]